MEIGIGVTLLTVAQMTGVGQYTYQLVPALLDLESKDTVNLENYILHVGTLEPRKNIPRLLKAFSIIPQFDGQLVLVGIKGYKFEQISELILQLGLLNKIRILVYVQMDDIPAFV